MTLLSTLRILEMLIKNKMLSIFLIKLSGCTFIFISFVVSLTILERDTLNFEGSIRVS